MGGEWVKKKIGALGRVVTGKTPPTSDPANFGGPYPFITIPDLDGRVAIDHSERTLSQKGADILKSCLLPPGSVMMSCIATVGKCGITTKSSFTNQQINSVIPTKSTDARFLYYVFTQLGNELESAGGGGSVYINVSKSRFADIEVMLPKDIGEQRAIAHILGTLDDKIELNRRMSQTLEEMARAIFKSWFVDFDPVRAKAAVRLEHPDWTNAQVSRAACPNLKPEIAELFPDRLVDSELGEIPEGWGVKKIGELVKRLSVREKYDQKTVCSKGKIPVLDQGKSGIIGYHNEKPGVIATEETPVVIFANHTCYIRIIYFSFSTIQNVIPFISNGVDTIWLYYATYGKQSFIEYKGHWPDFIIHKIIVPLPILTEKFSKTVHQFLKKIWQQERESCTLASLRDSLLPKLISGALQVKDAEDFLQRRGF